MGDLLTYGDLRVGHNDLGQPMFIDKHILFPLDYIGKVNLAL